MEAAPVPGSSLAPAVRLLPGHLKPFGFSVCHLCYSTLNNRCLITAHEASNTHPPPSRAPVLCFSYTSLPVSEPPTPEHKRIPSPDVAAALPSEAGWTLAKRRKRCCHIFQLPARSCGCADTGLSEWNVSHLGLGSPQCILLRGDVGLRAGLHPSSPATDQPPPGERCFC